MSQAQAETLLDAMRRETKSKAARVAVLRLAIGPAGKRGLYEVLEAMFHLVVDIADDDEHHASRATVHGLILHAFGDD